MYLSWISAQFSAHLSPRALFFPSTTQWMFSFHFFSVYALPLKAFKPNQLLIKFAQLVELFAEEKVAENLECSIVEHTF